MQNALYTNDPEHSQCMAVYNHSGKTISKKSQEIVGSWHSDLQNIDKRPPLVAMTPDGCVVADGVYTKNGSNKVYLAPPRGTEKTSADPLDNRGCDL